MARLAPPRRRPTARSERGPRAGGRGPMPQRGAAGPFGVPVQPKLAIGPARDRFEAEADRAADHVMGSAPGVPAITPLATAPAMRMAAPEDEAVQRAVKDESEEVQRQVEDEDEDEDGQAELLQPKSDGGGSAPAASPSVEAGIHAARGSGSPLPAATRGRMEQGFGRDFSAVRVHDDSRAARLNDAVNARAFTTGSDVFFARGAYAPGSTTGDRLLAHELAHVAQQSSPGQLQPKRIQRDGPPPPPARDWTDPSNPRRGIELDGPSGKILYRLPHLQLPRIDSKIKGVDSCGSITGGFMTGRGGGAAGFVPKEGTFHWTGQGERHTVNEKTKQIDDSPQSRIWDTQVINNSDLAQKITDKFEGTTPSIGRGGVDGPRVYYLRHRDADADRFTLIGTADEIARMGQTHRPPYAPDGNFTFMQVDHYVEIQLGGAHHLANMWLLDQSSNGSSGSRIASSVEGDLRSLVHDAQTLWETTGVAKPQIDGWPDNANIDFGQVQAYNVSGASFWDQSQIRKGTHLDDLRPLTPGEMRSGGFTFIPGSSPTAITVFHSSSSPFRKRMTHSNGVLHYGGSSENFIRGFNLYSATYNSPSAIEEGQQVATLTGKAFGNRSVPKPGGGRSNPIPVERDLDVPVKQTLDSGFGGYIDTGFIDEELRKRARKIIGWSPISVQSAGLTENWEMFAEARVTPDVSLLRNFQFALRAQGDAIILDVKVPTDNLDFGPFEVSNANISLGYTEQGPIYGGSAGFSIHGVGSGTLEASESRLAGTFNFDIDAFDPAELAVTYADGIWTGSATLGIKPGTIPFIEQGTINTGLNEQGNFFLVGTAILAGTGIPPGTELNISYNQETGEFTFGGDVPLDTSRLPGLTNSRVGFTVTRTDAGDYRVDGTGSAAFSRSGISGRVAIDYINGILTANGEAVVNRPPLTGSANFHLSNQAVGDDGQPIEGPPLDTFRAWGGGNASIQFGRYITGTAGIQFLENGEIELMGQIALPPAITLIEATRYHYDIFTFPEVRFPIIGFTIPVIRRSFGVFGFISGGLDANLTLGPGELVDSQVTVTYNPDRPEDMAITGGSTFQIGASADVGLRVSGGIGAGLAIVEATGEVGLRGALGLELSGGASVLLNWTPTDGLSIDASVFGEAQPTFSISVVADARVVVDAVLWSGTLWNESWERELASIGPDMRWRAELPARWSEQDGLEADINNLELTYPDIDLRGLAVDVFEAIA